MVIDHFWELEIEIFSVTQRKYSFYTWTDLLPV